MSWKETTLGKSFEIYQPQTIATKDLDENGKYLVYGANGVIGRYDKFNHEEPQLLLTCRGATCGAINISAPYSWINGNAMVIKSKINDINIRFIEYFFRGVINLSKAITGSAQPQITRQSLSPIIFRYPPLPIQQKIVVKLDAIFSEIDKAVAAAEANVKNAEALFQSYLKEAYKSDKNWKTVTLGEVCKVIAGQSPKGTNYNKVGKGLPFYQGKKDFGEKYINLPTVWTTEITKEAIKDDILISVRAPVGPVNIATEHICIGRGLAAIRTTDKINKSYLFNYLLKIEKELVGNAGAVFNSINKKQIENLKVPLPNLTIQQDIVLKINKISSEVSKLNNLYKNKLSNFVFFKNSILKQAFNGELVKAA